MESTTTPRGSFPMKASFVVLAAAASAALALQAPPATAATSAANATAFCQSALPVFDTQIRKRPLAVGNEGAAPAFVTCSLPQGYYPETVINGVVILLNRGASPVSASCTLVDGVTGEITGTAPGYYPQSAELAPGVATPLVWYPDDHGLESFHPYQSYSCLLPPGVEINVVGHDYIESP